MIKGVLITTNGKVEVLEIENELSEYYRILECDYIEAPPCKVGGKWFTVVSDEEGRLKPNMPTVCFENCYPYIVGNSFIVNCGDEDFESLTDEDVELIMANIRSTEDYSILVAQST